MAGAAVLRTFRAMHSWSVPAASGRCSAPMESVLYTPWRTTPVRAVQLCSALCAGHNKWSKVKNIKGPKDAARSRLFAKLGMMIRIAVKEGGPNPEMNINLAHILEQCRNKNMPKASIETAVKSVEKGKPASQHMFQARGPGGCLLLIEVLTDNVTRTHQAIKHLLNKRGWIMSDGAHHSFNRKGVVVVLGHNISMERALELAIEAGAEDVKETEDEEEQCLLKFICEITDLKKVQASLQELGMQTTSVGLEFVPCTLLSLDQGQLESASKLKEDLSDFSDVVHVWDNIKSHS